MDLVTKPSIQSRVPKPGWKKNTKDRPVQQQAAEPAAAAASQYHEAEKSSLQYHNRPKNKDELPSEMRPLQKLEFCVPALSYSERNVRSLA
eukprot:scaffold710_cov171-Amphora_coffeaeformis.AAC.9